MRPLRIAMLTHSTHPRGGVVHALELSDALQALGHRVTLHAPDPAGRGFFRATPCETVAVPARPVAGGTVELVRQRVAEYLAHFERTQCGHAGGGFDIWHAQDSISANALATMVEQGWIGGFVRTVHHLDRFDEPQLMAWQARGFQCAQQLLCVSGKWRDALASEHGLAAQQVRNGVNLQRYRSEPTPADAALRRRLGLREQGPVLLSVGGIEARKNTVRALQACVALRATHPNVQLVIAGGASLLDHGIYRAEFDAAVHASSLRVAFCSALGAAPANADVVVTGPLHDDDMPPLYRCADVLLFPSVHEGFGLVVLEALACGTPVVVSRIAPFTEHLDARVVHWCDPADAASIARAARLALEGTRTQPMLRAARPLLERYSWASSAARHTEIYGRITHPAPTRRPEPLHA
jgi:glycosyltransferase-like protein